MLYHYLASDKTGKIVEADHDAENLEQMLQYLGGQELRPVSVQPLKRKINPFGNVFGGINLTDKVFLAKYLSLMLRVGADLLSAINILIADFDKPAMKNFLLEVRDNLTHGNPFYKAFERYPKAFSSVFVNLVKAAETSGNLQQTFEELSDSLQREAELRSNIRAALVYPVIILVASLSIFVFLSTFALPKIANVFLQSGLKVPTFSRIVFGVGLFVNDHVWALLTALFTVAIALFLFLFKTEVGRRVGDRLFSSLPLIKKVYREVAVQRFASTYAALLKAGLPIVNATKLTADVVSSSEFKFALIRIADEGLAKGLTIGDAFRKETVFPNVVTNLIAISEKAGHLEEVLKTLADFYAVSINGSIKILVGFLEPLLLLFMGLLVGSIALSIVVPIYQLTSSF